jgi:hypothetical protein
MAVGCGSGKGVTGLSGRGLTDGGGAGVWRLIHGTATEGQRMGLGSCCHRRRIAMAEQLTGIRRRWRGEELRWRGLELGHGVERRRGGAPASATEVLQARFQRCREEGGRQRCGMELRPRRRQSGWEEKELWHRRGQVATGMSSGSYTGYGLGTWLMQRSRRLCSSSGRGRSLDVATSRRWKTAVSREAAVALREVASRLSSLMAQNQISP